MNATLTRLLPALPILVSLSLSACTVGSKPDWQDSALYLTAVHEFSVLYPPGFVLYLGLCKVWTLALGFIDFTLAVHLFSSACAALAAGVLGKAAEKLTGDRVASVAAACLAAAGYTWWFSGLYAKCYALYFLLVALTLWRMSWRDHGRAAVCLGLAWAAHPSAALLAPAAILYGVHCRADLRAMGARRLSGWVAAALAAAFVPSLLLPAIAARDSVVAMGHPQSFKDVAGYILGSRFTGMPGVWGFVGWRWSGLAVLAWEEFLGLGGAMAVVGTIVLFRERRPERWMLLAWVVPIVAVSTLFKIEGQYDLWLVAAWMPLWVCAALGISALRARMPRAPLYVLAGGLAWSLVANGRDLNLRNEARPELLGRSMLQNVAPGAILVVSSDDALGTCRYMQTVRGYRTDVRVVQSSLLGPVPEIQWYGERLARHWPGFVVPDWDLVMVQANRFSNLALVQAAIVMAQKPGSPPVYFDREPPAQLLQTGSVTPAGFLWKWSENADERPDLKDWSYPVTLKDVVAKRRRVRGIHVEFGKDTLWVAPEAYEDRLIYMLAEAHRTLGDLAQRQGTREGYERSALEYESIRTSAPHFGEAPQVLYPLALDYFLLDRPAPAAELFARVADSDATPLMKSGALFYLGEILTSARQRPRALEYYRRALAASPEGSPLRAEIEKRLSGQR